MHHALLVGRDAAEGLRLAASWSAAGDTVTAVLLAEAAAIARPGHADAGRIDQATAAGVDVRGHDEALRRRGISAPVAGVKPIDLDELADLVTVGADRAVWA